MATAARRPGAGIPRARGPPSPHPCGRASRTFHRGHARCRHRGSAVTRRARVHRVRRVDRVRRVGRVDRVRRVRGIGRDDRVRRVGRVGRNDDGRRAVRLAVTDHRDRVAADRDGQGQVRNELCSPEQSVRSVRRRRTAPGSRNHDGRGVRRRAVADHGDRVAADGDLGARSSSSWVPPRMECSPRSTRPAVSVPCPGRGGEPGPRRRRWSVAHDGDRVAADGDRGDRSGAAGFRRGSSDRRSSAPFRCGSPDAAGATGAAAGSAVRPPSWRRRRAVADDGDRIAADRHRRRDVDQRLLPDPMPSSPEVIATGSASPPPVTTAVEASDDWESPMTEIAFPLTVTGSSIEIPTWEPDRVPSSPSSPTRGRLRRRGA